jgi:hypothetical protein
MTKISGRPKFVSILLCVAGSLLCFLLLFSWWNTPSRPLFFWASEVNTWSSNTSFNGDGTDLYRARCSEEVFHRFARQQHLNYRIKTADQNIQAWSSSSQTWWNPPHSMVGAYYFRREGGERRLLAYADGYLYYDCTFW